MPVDLSHMRTVKLDHHIKFAQENDMTSFQVSAKTGDQVGVAVCTVRLCSSLLQPQIPHRSAQVSTALPLTWLVLH